MDSSQYIQMENQYGAKNYKPLDAVLDRGEGIWVWDVDGNKYMDCLSAYSAVNQGHCHPRIREAAIKQMEKLTLTSRAFRNDQLPLLYEEICKMTNSHKMLPMNSGAEAVESAIKCVRKWGYVEKGVADDKAEIIVAEENFHGRTTTIVSFSTDPAARDNFGPFTPGFVTVPYGDAAAIEAAVTPNTVAVMIEPIQGEAGVNIPAMGYLQQVRRICTDNNVVMVLDEIQTGLGRTGKMLAEEHEGVEADVTLVGKALSGGFYPVSAVLSNDAVLDVLRPGEHGSTFGGNPLACAIAREALKVLTEEGMIENSAKLGEYFLNELRGLGDQRFVDVRGRGLMIGLELDPTAGGARQFCEALKAEGLLCKETHENIIRFAPPLVIKQDEVDWALERIAKVFKEN